MITLIQKYNSLPKPLLVPSGRVLTLAEMTSPNSEKSFSKSESL